jgi:hypothetical protein
MRIIKATYALVNMNEQKEKLDDLIAAQQTVASKSPSNQEAAPAPPPNRWMNGRKPLNRPTRAGLP